MSNNFVQRLLLLVLPIAAVKLAGPEAAGPLFIVAGGLLIIFAVLILPGWWLKFTSVPVSIIQFPDAPIKQLMDFEWAAIKGKGILFTYEVDGIQLQGRRDRRWAAVFRPFAGSMDALSEAQKGYLEKKPTVGYVQEGDPRNAYLVVNTDWPIVGVTVFLGVVSIGMGLAFNL